jgi:hypothetical protein
MPRPPVIAPWAAVTLLTPFWASGLFCLRDIKCFGPRIGLEPTEH